LNGVLIAQVLEERGLLVPIIKAIGFVVGWKAIGLTLLLNAVFNCIASDFSCELMNFQLGGNRPLGGTSSLVSLAGISQFLRL